jgi:hypothetical protein
MPVAHLAERLKRLRPFGKADGGIAGPQAMVWSMSSPKPRPTACRDADDRVMTRRFLVKALGAALWSSPAIAADPPPTLQEPALLHDQVESGVLPPINQRIPKTH